MTSLATTPSDPGTGARAFEAASPLDEPPTPPASWWRRLTSHDPRSARRRDLALAVLVVAWMLSDLALSVTLDDELFFAPAASTSVEVELVEDGADSLALLDEEMAAVEAQIAEVESQLDEPRSVAEVEARLAEIEALQSRLDELREAEAEATFGGLTQVPSAFTPVEWALAGGLYLLVGVLLLVRRRRPSVVFWLVGLVVVLLPTPVTAVGTILPTTIASFVALYTVASEGTRTSRVVTGSLVGAGLLGTSALLVVTDSLTAASALVSGAAPHIVVWALGALARAQREQAVTATARAERLRAEQADSLRRATHAERSRIARELHDVVAHHLSLIVVQAEAARAAASASGQRPPASVEAVGSTGRVAMTELHRLLGVLRSDDAPSGSSARQGAATGPDAVAVDPQPTLDELPALVATSRQAGLPVDLVVEGAPRPIAPGIGVSAYRIVQEALTNVRKHAGPARAAVTVTWAASELRLRVVDDGIGTALADGSSVGHGLTGIRERASLLGGTAETAPAPGGGFVVDVRLPLPASRGDR